MQQDEQMDDFDQHSDYEWSCCQTDADMDDLLDSLHDKFDNPESNNMMQPVKSKIAAPTTKATTTFFGIDAK